MIEEAILNGSRSAIACDDMRIDVKTFKRWKNDIEDKRKGPRSAPSNKLSEDEKNEVIRLSTSKEYVDLAPTQIVPLLADRGVYIASESTFYKILKEKKLLKHRGKSKGKSTNRPTPLVATSPNEIYSWDITYLKSNVAGSFYYLYMFMDIYSRKIVGFEVFEKESMENSSMMIERICVQENVIKNQLILHSDNGGAMKGATMLATLQKLGVIPSFSRPRVSDDNPYSESLFKTLKYCPQYPTRPFGLLQEANAWVEKFVFWYNNIHLHSGIKFVTPASRHRGEDKIILEKRKKVYEEAKNKNPNRWSGNTRNWNKIDKVFLNYLQEEKNNDMNLAS